MSRVSSVTFTNAKYAPCHAKLAHRPSFIKEHCISEWQRVGLGRAGNVQEGRVRERRQPAAPSCAPSSSGPSVRQSVRLCCEIGSSGFVFPQRRPAAAAEEEQEEEEDYSTATHYAAEFVCFSGYRLRGDAMKNQCSVNVR